MGRTESRPDLKSEMARSLECRDQFVQKVFDTADVVREAMLRQLKKLGANQFARHFTKFCRTGTHSGV
jgi:hypothetical protein